MDVKNVFLYDELDRKQKLIHIDCLKDWMRNVSEYCRLAEHHRDHDAAFLRVKEKEKQKWRYCFLLFCGLLLPIKHEWTAEVHFRRLYDCKI